LFEEKFVEARYHDEWTEEHDNCFCQEILVLQPFKYKKEAFLEAKSGKKLQTI